MIKDKLDGPWPFVYEAIPIYDSLRGEFSRSSGIVAGEGRTMERSVDLGRDFPVLGRAWLENPTLSLIAVCRAILMQKEAIQPIKSKTSLCRAI